MYRFKIHLIHPIEFDGCMYSEFQIKEGGITSVFNPVPLSIRVDEAFAGKKIFIPYSNIKYIEEFNTY